MLINIKLYVKYINVYMYNVYVLSQCFLQGRRAIDRRAHHAAFAPLTLHGRTLLPLLVMSYRDIFNEQKRN